MLRRQRSTHRRRAGVVAITACVALLATATAPAFAAPPGTLPSPPDGAVGEPVIVYPRTMVAPERFAGAAVAAGIAAWCATGAPCARPQQLSVTLNDTADAATVTVMVPTADGAEQWHDFWVVTAEGYAELRLIPPPAATS